MTYYYPVISGWLIIQTSRYSDHLLSEWLIIRTTHYPDDLLFRRLVIRTTRYPMDVKKQITNCLNSKECCYIVQKISAKLSPKFTTLDLFVSDNHHIFCNSFMARRLFCYWVLNHDSSLRAQLLTYAVILHPTRILYTTKPGFEPMPLVTRLLPQKLDQGVTQIILLYKHLALISPTRRKA